MRSYKQEDNFFSVFDRIREIAMNDAPSDVSGSITDIFILSVSETVSSLFTEHLEKKGYRVTLFTDGNYLLKALREGKPNLLICDMTAPDDDGFEVCRRIKMDDDLWVIPVLILTAASTLSDLLAVLDCNADNFMPYPIDLNYSSIIIDSMVGSPVERQTPDQIKTQFKISHDDRIYVVAANRRKLLEFLLSSFEIAVTKSAEMSQVRTELDQLSESTHHLEERITEQNRSLNNDKTAIREKEQKILTFTAQLREKEEVLAKKSEEIDQIARELEENKALLATYEENLRSIVQEIKDIEASHRSEIDSFRQQVSNLTSELDCAKTNLETVQTDLDEEKIHTSSLECTQELLVAQKETVENALRSLTTEHEEQKSALTAHKNRITAAEQEIEEILLAKTQSEQELSRNIAELSETVKQQYEDLNLLKNELETEKSRLKSAENQTESIRTEGAQRESLLQLAIDDRDHQIGEQTARYKSVCLAREDEQATITLLRENLSGAAAEKEKTEEQIKTDRESFRTSLEHLKNESDELSKIRQSLEQDLSEAKVRTLSLEEELHAVSQDKENSGQQVLRLTEELEQAKAAFENGQETIKTLRENIAEAAAEKEKIKEQTKTELESFRASLEHVKNDFDELSKIRSSLEEDHGAAKARTLSLEEELHAVSQDKENSGQQVLRLTEELEKVTSAQAQLKNDFDDLVKIRSSLEQDHGAAKARTLSLEEELHAAYQTREESGQQVRSLTEELEKVKKALEDEKGMMQALRENLAQAVAEKEKTEEQTKTELGSFRESLEHLKDDLDETITIRSSLEQDLRAAKAQTLALEEELRVVSQTKEQSGQQVLSLADELKEVKAALSEKQKTIKSLRENIEEVLLEKEKTEEQTKTDLESFRESLEHLKVDLDETSKVRSSLERDLSAANARALALEEELQVVTQTKEQSGQKVRSITEELEQVKDAFEQEQVRIQSLEENLARSAAEKEKMEELAKTDLDSYKTTFIKLKRDLDETNASCTRFERELEIARTQNKAYENELNLASQNKEQSGLQVHSLAEELEKMKAALESERNLHRAGDESLEKVLQTLGRVEQDLHQSVEERDHLNESLENERKVRVAAEEGMNAAVRENEQLQKELHGISGQEDSQENALSEQITTLTRDLEQLYEIRKSLEEQVVLQNKEKSAAERKVLSLTSELEQARTALADEWEDHMTSDERLAAAVEERSRLQQAFSKKEQEKIVGGTGQALIPRTNDVLPVIVKPESQSLAKVTSHDLQKQPVPEPAENPKKESEIIHDSITDEAEEVPGRSEEDKISVDVTEKPPETVEPDQIPGDSGRTGPAGIFSFNRKEWYDLLRWAHHSKTLTHDQRMQIVRMGRLIQKDRKLTGKQEEQVGELIALVQALGYKPR